MLDKFAISQANKFMASSGIHQSLHHSMIPHRLDFDDHKLWQAVVEAPAIFAFFDFDGTLAEIAPTPADVLFREPRKDWLKDFISLPECSVGIVSGRPIDELRKLIGLEQIFYVGCHGLEWAAPNGEIHISWANQLIMDALRSLRDDMFKAMAYADGIVLEDKGIALALHYRRADPATALAARKEFVRAVHGYQQQGAKLELLAGQEVIEAKPTGMTKDDAIKQILARYGSTALPIYLGDERSDEAAFLTIADKGLSILVAETPRETAATLFLKDPTEVYLFLRRLTDMREKRK